MKQYLNTSLFLPTVPLYLNRRWKVEEFNELKVFFQRQIFLPFVCLCIYTSEVSMSSGREGLREKCVFLTFLAPSSSWLVCGSVFARKIDDPFRRGFVWLKFSTQDEDDGLTMDFRLLENVAPSWTNMTKAGAIVLGNEILINSFFLRLENVSRRLLQ